LHRAKFYITIISKWKCGQAESVSWSALGPQNCSSVSTGLFEIALWEGKHVVLGEKRNVRVCFTHAAPSHGDAKSLSNKQLATDSARFGVKTYAALTSYGGALTPAKQTPAELWRTMAQLGNKPNTPLIRCFSTNVQGLSMDGFFFQVCGPVLRESEMRKTAKLKSNRSTILLSPPGAAPCILQHFVAICFLETEWQNCLQVAQQWNKHYRVFEQCSTLP